MRTRCAASPITSQGQAFRSPPSRSTTACSDEQRKQMACSKPAVSSMWHWSRISLSGVRLDNNVGKLVGIVESPRDIHGVLKLLPFRCGRHSDLTSCYLLTLLLDNPDHVLRDQAEREQLLRVHPDSHRILAHAKH